MFKRIPLLLFGLVSIYMASSAAMAQVPFTTTTIVNGDLSPIANGAALLNAVAMATSPSLIKVEPGSYNLDGDQLVMRNGVSVEGSGRGLTFIYSDVSAASSNATVVAPLNVKAELRGLTVSNLASGDGTGVRIESNLFLLNGINVTNVVGGSAIGVDVSNCDAVIRDVSSLVLGTGTNVGFRLDGGSPILKASSSFVPIQSFRNIALEIAGDTNAQVHEFVGWVTTGGDDVGVLVRDRATVDLRTAHVTVISSYPGLNSNGYGLFATDEVSVEIKESTFKVLGDTLAEALRLTGSARVKTTGSTFIAGPVISDHPNIFAVRLFSTANLDSNQSNFESTSVVASSSGASTARFGASQLIGSITAGSATSFQCVFSYNGSYTARAANCL